MCGIFGMVVPHGKKIERTLVQTATDKLFHRGPDSGGCFLENNVALGNRRLAIIDLSDTGNQPMTFQGLTITYNGELYNYVEIRTELIKIGHFFKTSTDTEVILAAYKEWGTNCVQRFNGMWAFAIYDSRQQIVFCSRDRFGIKPFYFIWTAQTFAFASEIKAFKPLPLWKPILNQEIASDYLTKGLQNHTNQTLFKNVNQLPAGHHLFFDLKSHSFQIEKYYDISTVEQNAALNFDEAAIEFRRLLKDSIRLHSRSDVKVGSALSGGLDSSSIVALQYEMQENQKNKLEVVAYTSDIPEFDESPFVESLIKKYPVSLHKTSSSFEETMLKVDEVIKAHDEPLLSASLIAQYFVFKAAKENKIKVMLDGQGADELLAGYGTYYMPFLKEIGPSRIIKLFQEVLGLLGKHHIKLNKKLSFFKKNTDYQQYLYLYNGNAIKPIHGFRNHSNYMIQKGILPALLQFEDRNSMANSVESRVPFLDYRLVEFCMSLPAEFKIKNGVRKAILREGMKNDLPGKILNRYDKMGFTTPQESWLSQNPEIILETIQNAISYSPEIFDERLYQFAAKVLSKKRTSHYSFLWRVMTFGRWLELYKIK